MAKIERLSSSDRELFQLVSRATFSNPFSDERTELDRQIAGSVGSGSDDEIQARVIQTVTKRVEALAAARLARLDHYAGGDRELVRALFLFEGFHQLRERFDQLIRDQIEAGEGPCPVPFARDAIRLLLRRGFPADEARRYFAFFYQLRRAFFFIVRGLVGESRSMKELRLHLWNNVFTHNMSWYGDRLWDRMEDFSTLLLGDTGTGKGTAAAAIGRSGFIPFDERNGCFAESFARNFIAINLSQYPETLIESELFGHRKGAFTGAIDHHDGVFSRCTPHGAIFLDEVGDISIPVQVKLLQVLQERTFSKVGSHEKLDFRGRVIAATNQPLDDLRRSGRFRDDLYYRLCSDIIVVPPLRQRLGEDPGELDRLLSHLVVRMTGGEAPEIVATVRSAIQKDLDRDYAWPGNVRELEQAVRRVLVTRSYSGDVGAVATDLRGTIASALDSGRMDAHELLCAYCSLLYERHGTYEEVARRTKLDRRTVKKYVLAGRGDG